MYDFHYNVMKKKYGSKIQLCLTDTDSFLYDIETEDAYLDMTENMEIFDTSNYPKDHFLFNLENKKVLGKIKDETAGVPPLSLVGLRSKMYSFKVSEETEKNTGKGIPRSALRKNLDHEQYRKCLFSQSLKYIQASTLRSEGHQIYTYHISKLGLSPFDDKRYIIHDGIRTLAYGHYHIDFIANIIEKMS